MRETVLQFGTGNFLRAFLGDFLDVMQTKGLYDGGAVIVSPTDSKNVDVINARAGRWHLLLRGVKDGREVSEMRELAAVTRAVNPYRDFEAFLSLAENPDLRFVVSNTTEAGIAFDPTCRLTDAPASAFPAKLTQLLYRRWQKGLPGFVMLPCELIDRNADFLRQYVLQYIDLWELPEGFRRWAETENRFCNTLVDRIVTGFPADADAVCPGDPLLDAAEPYHFWAIEGDFETELPLQKAGLNAVWADDISGYKKRKVRVLNGAHTSIVFPALLAGLETVGDCMEDGELRAFLGTVLDKNVLPVLGDTAENRAFAGAVLERFQNPFLHHKLTSIALNSVSKFTARVLPTMLEYKQIYGVYPRPMELSLCALIEYYRTHDVSDLKENVDFIRTHGIKEILADTALWGADLSDMETADVTDIREAIRWAIC